MKKRLFLFIALIMALCAILAISVSAKTITATNMKGETIEVNVYDEFPKPTNITILESDIVVFDDGYACLSAYVFNDISSIPSGSWQNPSLKNNKVTNFSYIKEQTGKTYTFDNVVELDIPQGITTIGTHLAQFVTTLKRISFPDSVTSLGGSTFEKCTSIEECVFEHSENSNFTSLPQYLFSGSTNLKAFSMPDCITSLTGEGNHFAGCSNLTAVYLSKKLETIIATKGATFDNCNNLYFVNNPFTTSDTAEAKPEVYYFPKSLSTVQNTCIFRYCNSMNSVMVFDKKLTAVPNEHFFQNTTDCTIVFLGDMTEVNAKTWNTSFKGNKNIVFANPADKSTDDLTYTSSGYIKSTLFCASESDMTKHLESPRDSEISPATCYSNKAGIINCFCGREISRGEVEGTMLTTHDYIDDFDCTTPNYCKNFGENKCDKFLVADADAHNEAHDVIFANGFTSAGVHNTYCSNATCKALDKVEDLEAMFTHEGYAYKERTSGGIDTKFKINTKAMKLYEQYEGALHFGIIVANASHFANVDVFIENGKLTSTNKDGVKSGIQVEMTSRDYDYFNCYIGGFDFANEKHVGLDLIVAGYVYGEDESDISFIQKQYKTDDNAATLEIPYTAMVTKGATLKAVNIVTVRDFIPLVEKTEE